MVICMDSSISSTAFMEHLFSLVPRPASCMSERAERQSGMEKEREREEGRGGEKRTSAHYVSSPTKVMESPMHMSKASRRP